MGSFLRPGGAWGVTLGTPGATLGTQGVIFESQGSQRLFPPIGVGHFGIILELPGSVREAIWNHFGTILGLIFRIVLHRVIEAIFC